MQKNVPLINKITHKEVQIIWGLSKAGAINRLNVIRASLNKKRSHTLTVLDFCSAEDISVEHFDMLIKRAYSM